MSSNLTAPEERGNKRPRINRFYRAMGGRKQSSAYICAVLLTVMVFFAPVDSFQYYGAYLLAALGITNLAIAYEDVRRSKGNDI